MEKNYSFAEFMPNISIVVDKDCNILFSNEDAKKRFTIKSNGNLNLKCFFEKFKISDVAGRKINLSTKPFSKIINGEIDKTTTIIRVDDSEFYKIYCFGILKNNKVCYIGISAIDITQEMQEKLCAERISDDLLNLSVELKAKCEVINILRSKEKKNLEELENANKMKNEIFSMVTHELRTPLTIICSSVQLCKDVYTEEITPNIYKTLTRVNQNSQRLLKLVNNILDLSKVEVGYLELNNDLVEIVGYTEYIVESVNIFAATKYISVIFDTNEEEVYANIDRDKYEKIILNLLSNAIKFTAQNKKVYVTLNICADKIQLIVKDEGIGIPNDKLDKIFDSFTQVRSSLSSENMGTGLGLSLVKKFVELMDGKIHVESELGNGTKFVINFENIINDQQISMNTFEFDENISGRINLEFSDLC